MVIWDNLKFFGRLFVQVISQDIFYNAIVWIFHSIVYHLFQMIVYQEFSPKFTTLSAV